MILYSLFLNCRAAFCDRVRRRFCNDRRGNVAIMFVLAIVPMLGLGGGVVDYSIANGVKSRLQTAADTAALAATSSVLNGGTTDDAQAAAIQIFLANLIGINGQLVNGLTTLPTVSVSNINSVVTTSVSYSGATRTEFLRMIGMPTMPITITSGATGGANIGAAGSGTYYGSGSLSEDPVIRGADGAVAIFMCDYTGRTWYNLLSDAHFQINANCIGNSSWSEYYKVSILAGTHTISIAPSLTSVSWYGTSQIGESWMGDIIIDGVAYPAQPGTRTYLTDTTAGISVKVVVGQPGVVGSAANYALITTPTYSVSVAYDTDNVVDGSTGKIATFGFSNIQIAAQNAGLCGVPGGTWGGTLGRINDFNANDFIVSGPTSQSSQFNWNCTSAANANAKVRLTN